MGGGRGGGEDQSIQANEMESKVTDFASNHLVMRCKRRVDVWTREIYVLETVSQEKDERKAFAGLVWAGRGLGGL